MWSSPAEAHTPSHRHRLRAQAKCVREPHGAGEKFCACSLACVHTRVHRVNLCMRAQLPRLPFPTPTDLRHAVAREPAPRATTALGVPVGGHRLPVCERHREGRPGLPGSQRGRDQVPRAVIRTLTTTHTLTYHKHTCVLIHACLKMHTYLHTLIHATSTHALKCTHGLAQRLTLTHRHTGIHTCACSRSFLHVCSPSHTPVCTQTYSQTRTDSHVVCSHTQPPGAERTLCGGPRALGKAAWVQMRAISTAPQPCTRPAPGLTTPY